ncbi:MAG TPA: hypothetical protein ENN80_07200 [Candidatus Hydrogenedentes bacterium]|nr:hypothetical protein [Candidatus Hydrogenedentota bacterium]
MALRRATARGLALWVLFGIVAVGLRGIRWDEDYEFAQVIAGVVAYPDGHPLAHYARSIYSLQPRLPAALMAVTRSPALHCGVRNSLFLMATVTPPFLLGVLLTRRALYGHVAAALTLVGAHVVLYSTYPQFVWPHMYSNGHVGMGFALLTLYLLCSKSWRGGGFLLGLMPCIHLGQWTPLLFFAAIGALYLRRSENREIPWAKAAAWTAAGFTVSASVYCFTRMTEFPLSVSGPYVGTAETQAVWRGYMAHYASHRSLPWSTGHIALFAAPLLGVAAARCETREGGRAWPWIGVTAYGLCVASIVWSTMALHMLLGPKVPHVVVAWMPYRLMNHVSLLLVVMSVAAVAGRRDQPGVGWVALAAVTAFGIMRPLLPGVVNAELYTRYIQTGLGALLFLYGSAVGAVGCRLNGDRHFLIPWAVLGLIGWLCLAWVHQWGAACVALGAGAVLFLGRTIGQRPLRPARHLPAFLASILTAVLAYGQWAHREHLPVSSFERRMVHYLEGRGDGDAMLVTDYHQEGMQARTGHPIMTDMATMTWIPYRPSLGPALDKLYGDLYGFRFSMPPGEHRQPWFEHWRARTQQEWLRLGEEYDFRYVVAPAFIELDLPLAIEGAEQRLYRIPMEDPAE